MFPSTFSIVAYDRAAGEWGGAVASKFLAAGAVVLWARAGAGVVATQSYANTSYGPRGLDLLAGGMDAGRVLETLISSDDGRTVRQVGLVDREGMAATYTGSDCTPWAGGLTGETSAAAGTAGGGFAVQGNILVGEKVVRAMAETFASTGGRLARRLWAALAAGDAEGGDKRGRESAAILVCRDKGGYGGWNDRYMDLRVDDHPDPVRELGRLLDLHELYFLPAGERDLVVIDEAVARELQACLGRLGYWDGPTDGRWSEDLSRRLNLCLGAENLEDRAVAEKMKEGPSIDRLVLEHLRRRGGGAG